MYQARPHPVTVMTSFSSSVVPGHPDIKSPPPSSSPYYFPTFSSNPTSLSYSMTQPVAWNDTAAFGSFTPSPKEEAYSPPPPIMTSSAYHSPSSSNVSFEEDDMPLFFSPTTTHSPSELSYTSSSMVSFYPNEQSSQPHSFLTSPPPLSTQYHHSSPTTKSMHYYNQNQHYQQHPLCYSKQPPKSLPLARPYSCPTCPRAFARKHDLQRHIRVHTGAKPYLCMACKKPFARTDALKRHLRIEDACRLSPEIQALKGAGKRRYRNL